LSRSSLDKSFWNFSSFCFCSSALAAVNHS
jgi:hypothetical protein